MSKPNLPADPYKRHATRHRGVSYRLRADGSRAYLVYHAGSYVLVEGGEAEAIAKQAELRGRRARGERVVVNDRTTFAKFAEDEWYKAKAPRLRKRTARQYRDGLNLVLLPRFGSWRIAAIDAQAISDLIRDLEREGLHAIDSKRPVRQLGRSSIDNYLKPLQGVLGLAVRRRLIANNPFDHLTADDRPKREEKAPKRRYGPKDIEALFAASEALARKPESRHDYTPLLRLTAALGLRLGETLGLMWSDFRKDEPALYIERQWTLASDYGPPKTEAGVRRIALPSGLRDELIALRLRSRFSQDDDPIFASSRGTPLLHRNVTRRGFEPAKLAAGLDGLTFHRLRHLAVSRLIRGGLDPVTVAAMMGHEDVSTTLKVYAETWDEVETDAAVRAALSGAS
jgi:integrase